MTKKSETEVAVEAPPPSALMSGDPMAGLPRLQNASLHDLFAAAVLMGFAASGRIDHYPDYGAALAYKAAAEYVKARG